jgi:hypothetical protein
MPRPRDIDIILIFKAAVASTHISKQKARQEAQDAEDQYSRLLDSLKSAGLYAVGRRGEHQGQLIVFVSCPSHQLHLLLQRERQDPFFPQNYFHLSHDVVISTAIPMSFMASQLLLPTLTQAP